MRFLGPLPNFPGSHYTQQGGSASMACLHHQAEAPISYSDAANAPSIIYSVEYQTSSGARVPDRARHDYEVCLQKTLFSFSIITLLCAALMVKA